MRRKRRRWRRRRPPARLRRSSGTGTLTGGQQVLVCDDEPQILRALKVVLRDAGFTVLTAATAEEALDAAAFARLVDLAVATSAS